MAVRLLSPKTFESYFLDMLYVEFMKNFLLPDSSKLMVGQTHFGLLSANTFESYFLDMLYVEFMKNFLLADSSKLIAVRLISACGAQKPLNPAF